MKISVVFARDTAFDTKKNTIQETKTEPSDISTTKIRFIDRALLVQVWKRLFLQQRRDDSIEIVRLHQRRETARIELPSFLPLCRIMFHGKRRRIVIQRHSRVAVHLRAKGVGIRVRVSNHHYRTPHEVKHDHLLFLVPIAQCLRMPLLVSRFERVTDQWQSHWARWVIVQFAMQLAVRITRQQRTSQSCHRCDDLLVCW
mmetsp:Transcript_41837/g.68873  ORF Transcript_41837/g.68873 Transcript_41837/m.68873 type:complete len:200 (+) Transcript_41837:968-1567(+)